MVNSIGFFEHYINSFIFSRLDILSHDIRSNRQLPGAAIYQDSDQDPLRLSKSTYGFHGCANRPAAKDYIVDQYDGLIVHRDRNFKRDNGCSAYVMRSVISILTDVDDSDGKICLGKGLNLSSHAPGQMHAAGTNADEHQLVLVRRLLDNLVGHPAQGSSQFLLP